VVERQFQVVERQTQVAERRSRPFRLNLTTEILSLPDQLDCIYNAMSRLIVGTSAETRNKYKFYFVLNLTFLIITIPFETELQEYIQLLACSLTKALVPHTQKLNSMFTSEPAIESIQKQLPCFSTIETTAISES